MEISAADFEEEAIREGMVRKKVCVIGAGISGLVTTKVLLEDQEHFEVYVFEKSQYPC